MAPGGEQESGTIYFYLAQDDYGYFSNFSRHSLFLKGRKWPTSEHYFQAQKFAGTPLEEKIRLAPKPGEAANMGRSRAFPLRSDWEEVKEDVMKDALMAKFTQRKDLNQALLATRGKILVEHTAKDSYWGDGGDGSGRNRLGHLLMQVRDELLGETTAVPAVSEPQNIQEEEVEGEMEVEENGNVVQDKSVVTGDGDGEGEEEEEEGEGEQDVEVIEGVEPNTNHYYEAGPTSEPKKALKRSKKRGTSGTGKTKSKGSVFRDADGSSKIEKTSNMKGSVTVIGDGTVFSEKALPPQAKSVVNKHQKQRKYHATEADFEEEEEDYTPIPTRDNNNLISEFVDKEIVYSPEEIEEADALQLAMVASIQAKEAEEKQRKEFEKAMKKEKEIADCVEAAKANLELLSTLSLSDVDLLVTIQDTCIGLRNTMSRYITELTECENTEQLALVMEQFVKLQAAC